MSINVGIIGMGSQGNFYADVIYNHQIKNMQLKAFCSRSEVKGKELRDKYPDVSFYTDYQELFESSEVEAVIICTPHYLHPSIAKEALEQGIHVLVDKPAGVEASEVAQVNAVLNNKPHLSYGLIYNQRTNQLYKTLKQMIEEKVIGEIRNVHWLNTVNWRPNVYYKQNEWRATWKDEGGGVLINQAAHQIDLLQWIFGLPKRIFAKLQFGYQRDISVEDDATLLLEYESGATGMFISRTHDLLGTDRLEILGDNGKILVENNQKIIVRRLHKSEKTLNIETKAEDVAKIVQSNNASSLYEEEILIFEDEWGAQHKEIFENFANNILHDEPLIAPGVEGINSVEILNAAYVSGWIESKVDLPVDPKVYDKLLQKAIETEENKKKM